MPVTLYSRYYGRENVEIGDVLSLSQQPAVEVQEFTDSLKHTVVGTETLDQLAKRYYGREDLWWRIADANAGRFPLDWKPGDVLEIPPIRVATRMPRR